MLTSANDHYERQQRLTAAALIAARRKRRRDFRGIAQVIAAFQIFAARDALASIDPMLDEQGLSFPPVARVTPESFAGTASDGRGLTSLFEQASSPEALALMVVTQVQDAARGAAGTSLVTRSPRLGYVRMLNPPSCSRCAILAGRFYKWNAGFQRHPRCDCRHVPSVENTAGDLTTDPMAYYNSLDEAGKIKLAGSKANYRAIEDGADLTQLVNAYRGTSIAGESALVSKYGMKFTEAGATQRSRMFQQQVGSGMRTFDGRGKDGTVLRMMPESIYTNASSHAEALQMLRHYGWISDPAATAAGRASMAESRRLARNAARRAQRRQQRLERLEQLLRG